MATAQNVITSARYDLRDVDDIEYTDEELLDFVNRSNRVLYTALGNFKSELVYNSADLSVLAGNRQVSVPTDFSIIIRLWVDTKVEATEQTNEWITDRRKDNLSTGRPYYFALHGGYLQFEKVTDVDYTFSIEYYTRPPTDLALTSDMPFRDAFNDEIAQVITLMAKNRFDLPMQGSSALYDFFHSAAFSKVIARTHIPKGYKLNF